MVKNSFTDLLLNYEKMSRDKKMQRLQDLENMMARFQGRKPRIVSIKKTDKVKEIVEMIEGQNRMPCAYYSRSDKNYIHILSLKCEALDVIKDVIHEGWHAFVDDFINKKVTLKVFSKLDKEDFVKQQKYLPAIYDKFDKANAMPVYDSCYAEEKINYQENSIILIKLILDSIENVNDAIALQEALLCSMLYVVVNEKRAGPLQRQLGVNYDVLKNEAFESEESETVDLSNMGAIRDEIDPELLKFYQKLCVPMKQFSQVGDNKMISDEAKKQIQGEFVDSMLKEYQSYVSLMLKSKKKG